MAFSKIVIVVVSVPSIGTRLLITDDPTGGVFDLNFVTSKQFIGQITVGDSPTTTQVLYRIRDEINTVFNVFSTYSVSLDVGQQEITIVSRNVDSQFVESINTASPDVTTTITNGSVIPSFTIDSVSAAEASIGAVDTTVELTVTASDIADNITSPISQLVTVNPFVFETPRSSNPIVIEMYKDGVSATYSLYAPQLLSSYFVVNVKNTPSGATITIIKQFPLTDTTSLLTLEYSFNDLINWGISNSWSGIAVGTFNINVRDNLGSNISIPVTVEDFSPNLVDYTPLTEISNANALRFKINEVWDTNGISKNVVNTLSHEEDSKINLRSFLQPFQKNDIINAQIKSNYTSITAKIVDIDKNETPLTVIKSTDNMNKKDVRDGKIKLLNNGLIAIYFGAGNTYDPDTLVINGSYNIYEYLMDWINVGDYLNIEGLGWGKIDIIYSPNSSFNYYSVGINLQNDLNYVDDQVLKISTVYNISDYERYEFSIDCSTLEGAYYVVVNATDDDADDKEYISEWINVQDVHEEHHEIKYYSTKNNEINYGTGIDFTIRLPYLVKLKWSPNTEQEIYVTDTKTINLDSKVREFYKLSLMPIPTAMAQKVVLILAHNRLFIDGVSYLLEGEPESKEIGVSNLYQITANLVKADYVFDTQRELTASEILLGSGTPVRVDDAGRGLLFIE